MATSVDKTNRIPIEEALTLLDVPTRVEDLIDLEHVVGGEELDYLGCDYLIRSSLSNRGIFVSYRCLRWAGYETFTISDMGLQRMSEWDRLWADPDRDIKPHLYVVCYWDDEGPVHVAAAWGSTLRETPPDQWGRNTNPYGRRFRYLPTSHANRIWRRTVMP